MNSERYDRSFQTWKYLVSHGQLLIRSPKSDEYRKTIDIIFRNVTYMSVPRQFKSIQILMPSSADLIRIADFMESNVNPDCVFILKSAERLHWIYAASCQIVESELEYFQTPLHLSALEEPTEGLTTELWFRNAYEGADAH